MRWMILLSVLCSITLALPQDAQKSQPGAIPYLLRLERLLPYRDVCVLLRSDGQYHLEILEPNHTRILEGALSSAALRELGQISSSEKLAQLQQGDIRTPLVESERDEFLISILRLGRWQNLRFADGETREPYRELLDPLLKWLDRVQQEKAKLLTEEAARNNCLPPEEVHLKKRSGENAFSDNQTSAPSNRNYILRMVASQFDAGRNAKSCVLVSLSGAYHFRRSDKLRGKDIRTVVIDGILSADAVRSLRGILDADELKGRPAENPPAGRFIAGTLTSLWIPRQTAPQEINSWRYVYLAKSAGGGGDVPLMVDHDSAVFKPLNEWFRTILRKEREVQVQEPANPQCLPEAQ